LTARGLERAAAPLILGHRGASADHPENTLAAIDGALGPGGGADGVEVDVRLSRDGVAVVFHDDDTARLCGIPGALEARTAAQIAALRVHGEPIPTLAAVVAAFARHRPDPAPASLNVELKPTGTPEPLIAACRRLLDPLAEGAGAALVVSSFDPRVLQAAQRAGVPWRLALLFEDLRALAALPWLEAAGPVDLHPRHDLLTAAFAAEYARADRALRTWTVDAPDEAARLRALGVAAIITNRPALLRGATDPGPAPGPL
jgi:glycerophosphoryl diester phosphodiesterase